MSVELNKIIEGLTSSKRLVHLEDKGFVIMNRKETLVHQDGMTTSLPKLEQKIKAYVEQHLDEKERIVSAIEARKSKLEGRVKGFFHYFMSKATIAKINAAISSLGQMKSAIQGVEAKRPAPESSHHVEVATTPQDKMALIAAALAKKDGESLLTMPLNRKRQTIPEVVETPVPIVEAAPAETDAPPPPPGAAGAPPPPPPPMGPQKTMVHRMLTTEPKVKLSGEAKLKIPKVDENYDLNQPNKIPGATRAEYANSFEQYLGKLKAVVEESEKVYKAYQEEHENGKEASASLKSKEDDVAIIAADLKKLKEAQGPVTLRTQRSGKGKGGGQAAYSEVTFITDEAYSAYLAEYKKLSKAQLQQLAKTKGVIPEERKISKQIAVLENALKQAKSEVQKLQSEVAAHQATIGSMQAKHAVPFGEWEELLTQRKQVIATGEKVVENLRNGKKEAVREIKIAAVASDEDLDPAVQRVMRIEVVATYARERKGIVQEDEIILSKSPERFYGSLR